MDRGQFWAGAGCPQEFRAEPRSELSNGTSDACIAEHWREAWREVTGAQTTDKPTGTFCDGRYFASCPPYAFNLTLTYTGSRLLSPQSPDVAVSSFNSFHSMQPSIPRPTPPSNPTLNPAPESVKTVAHYPPESLQAQQSAGFTSGFASMGAVAPSTSSGSDSGEDLFAKALSPRSPDLPRSPFSFSPDTLHM